MMKMLISGQLHSCLIKHGGLWQICQQVSQSWAFIQPQPLPQSSERSGSGRSDCQHLQCTDPCQQSPNHTSLKAADLAVCTKHLMAIVHEFHAQQWRCQLQMNLPLLSLVSAVIPRSAIAIYSDGAGWSIPGKKEITGCILQLLQESLPLGTGHMLCYYKTNNSRSQFSIITTTGFQLNWCQPLEEWFPTAQKFTLKVALMSSVTKAVNSHKNEQQYREKTPDEAIIYPSWVAMHCGYVTNSNY